MIRKLLAALVLAALAVLAVGQIPTSAQSTTSQAPFNFEFLDIANNYTGLSDYPSGKRAEIVVASQNVDVRRLLPISLQILLGGKSVWTGTIPNNPATNCRGADGCSVEGPVISNTDQKIEITAKDRNNNLLASHSQGATPQQKVPQNNSYATTTVATPKTYSSSTNYFWWLGIFFGLMWTGIWWFVGRQWWNLGFWNFKWPNPVWFFVPLFMAVPWLAWGSLGLFNIWWPWNGWWMLAWLGGLGSFGIWLYCGWRWKRRGRLIFKWPRFVWFLIPLFWFVPWFLWWPFNWLAWGGWFWAWWWMFPWAFWLPWWIVVYKEKEIWLWNTLK